MDGADKEIMWQPVLKYTAFDDLKRRTDCVVVDMLVHKHQKYRMVLWQSFEGLDDDAK